jgi:hypothetical protein
VSSSSSSSSAGGGGAGGGAPDPYACTSQGTPTVILDPTSAPGAKFDENSFFVLPRTGGSGPFHFAAYDKTSRALYVRSAKDLTNLGPVATWPTPDGGDSEFTEADVTPTSLLFRGATTRRLGELSVVRDAQGLAVSAGAKFTDLQLPSACNTPPAHPNFAALGADGSHAYSCSDGNSAGETLTLYLDGVAIDTSTDGARVNLRSYHVIGGQRVIFTAGGNSKQVFVRVGTTAATLANPFPLVLGKSTNAIGLIGRIPSGDDATSMLLLGTSVPQDFSTFALFSGAVSPASMDLGGNPPKGMSVIVSGSQADKFLQLPIQPSNDGQTIALGGPSGTQHAVLFDLLDAKGERLVSNFVVANAASVVVLPAAAAHAGAGSFVVGWVEDARTIKAQMIQCTKNP